MTESPAPRSVEPPSPVPVGAPPSAAASCKAPSWAWSPLERTSLLYTRPRFRPIPHATVADARARIDGLAKKTVPLEIIDGTGEIAGILRGTGDGAEAIKLRARWIDLLEREIFAHKPIEYSSVLLARIDALGDVDDFVDLMDRKADILVRLYRMPESAFTSRKLLPGEGGPALVVKEDKAQIRHHVASAMAASNLTLNVPTFRSFLADVADLEPDPEIRVTLQPRLDELLGFWLSPSRDRALQVSAGGALLKRWIGRVRAQLANGGVSSLAPIALRDDMLRSLATLGPAYGLADEVRDMLREIVAREGKYSGTDGVANGAVMLYVLAQALLFELDARTCAR